MSAITLTTDFGTQDWFVGTMKGVILRINNRARIIDITHEIPAGDVRSGAFALAAAAPFFPKGTVHVAVVDPGVGSSRRAIAVRTKRFTFVGPDNGVLSLALAREEVRSVRLLQNRKLLLDELSHTFHGRDVFAPIAAHLSTGEGFKKVGPRAGSYVQLDWPQASFGRNGVTGQVVHIDHFGNAITNVPQAMLPQSCKLAVLVHGLPLCQLGSSYSSVPTGAPVAVIGSTGFLEIAINGGSAAHAHGLTIGSPIQITPI